jgi:hypothetical protein
VTFTYDGPPLRPPKHEPKGTDIGTYMLFIGLAGGTAIRKLGIPDNVDPDKLAVLLFIWFAVSLLAMVYEI